ncbi:GTP-binding protein, partial [Gordonia sp. UBA7599]
MTAPTIEATAAGRHDGDRQFLRLATIGSVDDGKSTLIGRILHDTGSLPTDHIEGVTDDEGELDLAALSDGLRSEREQGITID